MNKINTFLLFLLSISILFACMSIVYYYSYFLPQYNKQETTRSIVQYTYDKQAECAGLAETLYERKFREAQVGGGDEWMAFSGYGYNTKTRGCYLGIYQIGYFDDDRLESYENRKVINVLNGAPVHSYAISRGELLDGSLTLDEYERMKAALTNYTFTLEEYNRVKNLLNF